MNRLKNLFRPLHLALTAALVLGAGCGVMKPAEFYQLQAPMEAATSAHGQTAVLLGPVKLADYLQREQIMQRKADGRLGISRNGRWAGSLQDEVGQLLLRQVATGLGSSHVALYPDRIGVKAGAQVVLSISRLDSGESEPAVLEAQWRLLDANGEVRNSSVVTLLAEHSGELSSQVQAQSELLVQLSDQLVAAVKQLHSSQRIPAKTAPVREFSARDDAKQAGGMPLAEPQEREVYRF